MNKFRLNVSILMVLVMILTSLSGFASAQDENTLNILFWQAPSNVNPYLSGGTKELEASVHSLSNRLFVTIPMVKWFLG